MLKRIFNSFKVFLLLCTIILGVFGCVNESDSSASEKNNILSFRDIPEITESEISAIEALKLSRQSFSLGKLLSAEGFILPDGEYAGFSPMLCELLSDLFEIPFILKFHDWDSLLTGIENKSIDFTSEFGITEERQNKYYMSDPIAHRPLGVNYDFGGAVNLTHVQELLPLAYTPIALTTADAAYEPIISALNKYIASGGINTLYELYRTGSDRYNRNVLYNSFSNEEKMYIDNLSAKIPIVLGTDTYPVSFYNSNEGEFQGISIDVLMEISRLTGIEFEPINNKDASWGEILELLRSGNAALISDLIITEERKEYFIWPQTPFFSTPYAFFSKIENSNMGLYQIGQAAVGVVSWCATRQLYEQWFPNNPNVRLYDSQDDALEALEKNEIELFFNLGYILYYQQNYREKPGYKANYTFPFFNDTFFGLNKNEVILCSIIDKTISYINTERISNEWTNRSFDYSRILAEEQSRHANQRTLIVFVSAIFLLLLMLMLIIQLIINNKTKKTASTIFEANPQINALFDSNFNVVDCNPAALQFMGFKTKEEFISGFFERFTKSLPEIQPDGRVSIPLSDRLIKAVKEGYDRVETEIYIGGKTKNLLVEFIRIPYENAFALIAYAYDMTEMRNREKELMKAREEMDILRQEAEVASKSKSNFLSNMSHEMRTPMNAIIGMTIIGKKANDVMQKNHALNKIGDASSHLLGVINDVLDMAKIEANKLELSPIEFSFERMLQKVLTVINFRIDEKQQRLTLNIDSNIPRFLIGDDQRLAQVITNLLANAVKFTPENGEINLEAALLNEENGICELRIAVTDSGIGISPEKQEKLFSAFEQADSGTSRQYGGTGLGLSISKHIIEFMDGRIWFESQLGKGAKFTFTIKAQRCTAQLSENRETESCVNEGLGISDEINKNKNVSKGEFEGKNLLVAEDVEINREILIALLEDTGISIDCAENGDEAIKMVEADPEIYDIIFMDVQMPVMNGYEATRRIREFEEKHNNMNSHANESSSDNRYPLADESVEFAQQTPKLSERPRGVPIIALTANVFKSDIEECLNAGMDDHLGKPLDIDRVIEKLRKYLK
ncbi:MAG: transporter substrate-binding domain-containing protein [Treponema sp.]|nr:transporter substrate-binding domain-containing protein [Treponema sp.]